MRQIIIDFGTFELFGTEFSPKVYGYGLMLVLGFLTGIYLAQWRARRSGESPEHCPQIGILALIGGVVGARLAYIIENWDSFFLAGQADLRGMLNITSGGLIYFGGVVLATLMVLGYLYVKKLPLRRYLDIVAASMMLGLAFGRMGCFLNGCCYGGVCDPKWALAMEFPMYSPPLVKLGDGNSPYSDDTLTPSPPYVAQYHEGRVTPDPRLINPLAFRKVETDEGRRVSLPVLTPPKYFHGRLTNDQVEPYRTQPDLREAFVRIAGEDRQISQGDWKQAQQRKDGLLRGSETWDQALAADATRDGQLNREEFEDFYQQRRRWMLRAFDRNIDGELDASEAAEANEFLQADQFEIASHSHSRAIRPAQVLGIVNALLLMGILLAFYRLRRREGQVFALMLMLYPVTRFVLESVRADNPHDITRGVLTHNQVTSIILLSLGALMWIGLRFLPASAGPTAVERFAAAQADAGSDDTPKRSRRRKRR
ncbi:MAG: prolipoprotein diacylglyceryl transferase family protein [Phycisphaerae bacterium]